MMKQPILVPALSVLAFVMLTGCSSFSREKQIDVVESGLTCKWERTTGSLIKKKVCRPADPHGQEAKVTREQLRRIQSGVKSG